MSFGPRRPGQKTSGGRKKKSFLAQNKKFTAILLLIVIGAFTGVHLFMWQLHDKTCAVSCGDPSQGCWNPIGWEALFGPCHGFNAKTNQTQTGFRT